MNTLMNFTWYNYLTLLKDSQSFWIKNGSLGRRMGRGITMFPEGVTVLLETFCPHLAKSFFAEVASAIKSNILCFLKNHSGFV